VGAHPLWKDDECELLNFGYVHGCEQAHIRTCARNVVTMATPDRLGTWFCCSGVETDGGFRPTEHVPCPAPEGTIVCVGYTAGCLEIEPVQELVRAACRECCAGDPRPEPDPNYCRSMCGG
jgi:hypothetical protein